MICYKYYYNKNHDNKLNVYLAPIIEYFPFEFIKLIYQEKLIKVLDYTYNILKINL